MNRLGFSVIFERSKGVPFYDKLLTDMLQTGCDAIEVHTRTQDGIEQNPDIVSLIQQFPYRAVHTSDFVSQEANKDEVEYYKTLATAIGAAAVTIHPHAMQSVGWSWLHKHFGELASFENMDWRKPFGTSTQDMSRVFQEYPDARFTFDLNHVYTVDPSLETTTGYSQFADKLGHYHISGFAGDSLPHTTLHSTKQDSIIHAVSTGHPIIIESYGLDDIQDFAEEYRYVAHSLRVNEV